MAIQPLFNVPFLASKWEAEYQSFRQTEESQKLLARLINWSRRSPLNETATEAAFIRVFFCDTWEYAQQGVNADGSYQCYPQFPIARAGQTGGTGAADLGLGHFGLQWFRFGRNQNIDKQEIEKLCVAQTVPSLRLFFDFTGSFYFNNVRVNGILPMSIEEGWFLLGVLNAPVADFIFKRISKPKEGGYFEANKQFIAPLPIPKATEEQKTRVAEQAKLLQELHTNRRDLVLKCEKRLNSAQTEADKRNETWLWADVGTVASWKKSPEVPEGLKGAALTAWAKDMAAAKRQRYYEEWNARLHPGASITVEHTEDELRLKIDNIQILELFDEPDTPFMAAQ